MTDPRTAALAEALVAHPWRDEQTAYDAAAAILAALPADWCGHDGSLGILDDSIEGNVQRVDAPMTAAEPTTETGKRLWNDLAFAAPELWALHIDRRVAPLEAEIARLRRIEAAARRLLRYSGNALMTDTEQEDWAALRAALEEGK